MYLEAFWHRMPFSTFLKKKKKKVPQLPTHKYTVQIHTGLGGCPIDTLVSV